MMNNNNLFNFLNELNKSLENMEQYKTLDFTKKEDVDKLDNAIKSLKENKFFMSLFNLDLFDVIQKKAHDIYDEAKKKAEEEEAKKKAEEEDKKKKQIPIQPQTQVPEKVKVNIINYACEYLNTMILPYNELTEGQVRDIVNALTDFACWIYNKKE